MGCLQPNINGYVPYLLLSLLEPFARLRLKVSFMGSRHTIASQTYPNMIDGL